MRRGVRGIQHIGNDFRFVVGKTEVQPYVAIGDRRMYARRAEESAVEYDRQVAADVFLGQLLKRFCPAVVENQIQGRYAPLIFADGCFADTFPVHFHILRNVVITPDDLSIRIRLRKRKQLVTGRGVFFQKFFSSA